jgi:hypothetical protein
MQQALMSAVVQLQVWKSICSLTAIGKIAIAIIEGIAAADAAEGKTGGKTEGTVQEETKEEMRGGTTVAAGPEAMIGETRGETTGGIQVEEEAVTAEAATEVVIGVIEIATWIGIEQVTTAIETLTGVTTAIEIGIGLQAEGAAGRKAIIGITIEITMMELAIIEITIIEITMMEITIWMKITILIEMLRTIEMLAAIEMLIGARGQGGATSGRTPRTTTKSGLTAENDEAENDEAEIGGVIGGDPMERRENQACLRWALEAVLPRTMRAVTVRATLTAFPVGHPVGHSVMLATGWIVMLIARFLVTLIARFLLITLIARFLLITLTVRFL